MPKLAPPAPPNWGESPHVKEGPVARCGAPIPCRKTCSQDFGGEQWTSEGVKTFFYFGLHPMFGGKLDVGRPEDFFLRGKRGPRKMISGGPRIA